MAGFFKKLLSAGEGKQLAAYEKKVEQINALEPEISALSDEALKAKTVEFRSRLEAGETLDDVLVEAFAVVREAAKRTLEMRHFDVQLIGAMVLNEGMISEMKTGEGKTLVATAAVYLNALAGKGVHVVTVNDYLAKRDSEWMGRVYRFLGMEVGLIQSNMQESKRKPAYQADITYGTNAEFGFDYLRDNMATRAEDRVQRGHYFSVVDEVDSILIDEARTPLIISGAGDRSASTYKDFAKVIPRLQEDVDFELDEAKNTVAPTEEGISKVERLLSIDDIYSDPSGQMVNHLQQALKAQFLFKRDVNYLVADGEVLIVDEFTGRPMYGRRYSDGLHQAIEAKERVSVREENQTLATITLQNYFRMYEKLSGMTGTAITEDKEFREIYKLPVMVIPTNRPMVRDDRDDLIYRNVEVKYAALCDFVVERHAEGQPCLLGTISIESSERLSRALKKRGIPHNVLNAKQHEKEAAIIAEAGRLGAVTIATNMAGRGTDILLGGSPEARIDEFLRARGTDPEEASDEERAAAFAEAKAACAEEHEQVVAAGGLAVLGTERHDSRRIDNQLRGRSGRQGDPGLSQFYLSLEDDLMRLFGGDRMERLASMMESAQVPDDMPIQFSLVTKVVESAQRQVETMNFASRKHVLEYDDVMNNQRNAIYGERNRILDGKDICSRIPEMASDALKLSLTEFANDQGGKETWDIKGLENWFKEFSNKTGVVKPAVENSKTVSDLQEALLEAVMGTLADKENALGSEDYQNLARAVMLRVIDTRWMAHLQEMDYMREGIGLRAMGQRDPLVEYKNEAYELFIGLVASINEDFLSTLTHIEFDVDMTRARNMIEGASYSAASESEGMSGAVASATRDMGMSADAMQAAGRSASASSAAPSARTVVKDKEDPYANAERNDPCPCGSGKKFKKCHGA